MSMARSKRKSPFIGITTARSEKVFKTDAHRSERRSITTMLKKGVDQDDRRLHSKVYGDPWDGPKDGKFPVDPKSKWMRK
jgi:hypothetical protein